MPQLVYVAGYRTRVRSDVLPSQGMESGLSKKDKAISLRLPGRLLARVKAEAKNTHERHDPSATVFHRVVRENLETFLAEASMSGDRFPRYVDKEFKEFGITISQVEPEALKKIHTIGHLYKHNNWFKSRGLIGTNYRADIYHVMTRKLAKNPFQTAKTLECSYDTAYRLWRSLSLFFEQS